MNRIFWTYPFGSAPQFNLATTVEISTVARRSEETIPNPTIPNPGDVMIVRELTRKRSHSRITTPVEAVPHHNHNKGDGHPQEVGTNHLLEHIPDMVGPTSQSLITKSPLTPVGAVVTAIMAIRVAIPVKGRHLEIHLVLEDIVPETLVALTGDPFTVTTRETVLRSVLPFARKKGMIPGRTS